MHRMKISSSGAQVLKRAAAAAVDAEQIVQYACKSAAAAQGHVVEPESSDSGLDTKAGFSTVSRALRTVKGIKLSRKRAMASGAGARNDWHHPTREADGSQASSSQQLPALGGQQQHVGEAGLSSAEQNGACKSGLSEEEKRARKRAKRLAQKQRLMAEGAEVERRAREKARRARKKVRLKQQKQING